MEKTLSSDEDSSSPELKFARCLQLLCRAVNEGQGCKTLSFDYRYVNLWGTLFHNRPKHRFLFLKQEASIKVLKQRTYWYKRLKPGINTQVDRMCATKKGKLELKEVLHTADAVMMSLLLGFPEIFVEDLYKTSDKIINSLISTMILDYDGVLRTLKQTRKIIKKAVMSGERINLSDGVLRRLSWIGKPVSILNSLLADGKSRSKHHIYKMCMLTQTRASGLAGPKIVKEATEKFLKNVTVQKEFHPTPLLDRCVDQVVSDILVCKKPRFNNFKISMSTSACRENPKRLEGKFGFLRKLADRRGFEIPDDPLEVEEYSIGDSVWCEAYEKLRTGDESIREVNVAAVRENSKARIITSGSFFKDSFLQPFSHMTIEMLKGLPELRESLQASRHGWRFIERINHMSPQESWPCFMSTDDLIRSPRYITSTDFELATDNPTPQSAYFVMARLLRRTGLSEDYVTKVMQCWVGPKTLRINGVVVGTMVNGIAMGDPLTKSNLSMVHPICDRYANYKCNQLYGEDPKQPILAGNGDDAVMIHSRKEYAEFYLECSSLLGYKPSPDDTFTTLDWGTYCEEYFYIPRDRFNTCLVGNRLKDTEYLPYLDFPKIRIMVDTQKDREDFSSNIEGKVTLMGHNAEYIAKESDPLGTIFAFASVLQDVALDTLDYKRPMFMPRQVHGIGKPVPFWDPVSWCNVIKRSKPWHRKYYLRVMQEHNTGELAISGLRGVQKDSVHFEGESYVERMMIPEDSPIRGYIAVPHDKWDLFPEGVLEKLLAVGKLRGENKVSAFYLFYKRLRELKQDMSNIDLFDEIKSSVKELTLDESDQGVESTVKQFSKDNRHSPYTLRCRAPENLYLGSIVHILQQNDPLRVSLPEYHYLGRLDKETGLKVETPYQASVEKLYEWFVDHHQDILSGNDYPLPPVEIIGDDPIIESQIQREEDRLTAFLVVTEDKRLIRRIVNRNPGRLIGRIPVIDWIVNECSEKTFTDAFKRIKPRNPLKIIVDSGAFETYLYKTDPQLAHDRASGWLTPVNQRRRDLTSAQIFALEDEEYAKYDHRSLTEGIMRAYLIEFMGGRAVGRNLDGNWRDTLSVGASHTETGNSQSE